METKNKKKKITSKSLRVYAIIFLVVGAVYILSGIYSFFTTINGYVSQGYATSEVLMYLLPSQFLPTVIEPLAIFGGFALLLFGVSEVLSRLNADDNETVDEQEVAEEIKETEETEVIEDAQEEIKDEEANVNEDTKDAKDNEEVIEDDSLEENVETVDEETKEVAADTESEGSIDESTEEMDEEDNLDKTLDKEDKSSDNDDEHDE
ncbi:hypothetical protein [Anaerofustis stercorihominis]|uniref:hypothetical protein n=1 Tax=Anaerofustis stercorihominis TaxID=214853 RepID=UPI003991FC4B